MTASQIRAIVVEDDLSWQQILTEILTDAGLCVEVAGTLEQAIPMLKAEPHRLAVVDLSLEGADHHNVDGLQVLEAVKRVDPDCQCILLTGYATVELAVSVLTEYAAFSFLRKENFNRGQFRDLVNQALAVAPLSKPGKRKLATNELGDKSTQVETQVTASAKILVVEDDAGWRGILRELLADEGYETRACTGFGDALGALKRGTFSLAVVDLSLGNEGSWGPSANDQGLEGYQLLTTTREFGIPTIVVSGVASVDEIQRAYNEQAIYAYLEKQAFDRNAFRRLVKEALENAQHNSELNLLTSREREVFDMLTQGMTNKEIADELVITLNTVKRHLKAIFEKLGVHSRAAAIVKARGNQP
jgi:DNA-binding NarL/FixJ family response regulator